MRRRREARLKKGYVQVYTGEGKGKTTAALGLAVRAAGAGLRVFIGQFMKGRPCSEHAALKRFDDLIELHQYGEPHFVCGAPSAADRGNARKGFDELVNAVKSGRYDLVVMEEINSAVHHGLLPLDPVLELLRTRPESVELVLTGRHAAPELIEGADLVTEMREIKHYYRQGVQARSGIEK